MLAEVILVLLYAYTVCEVAGRSASVPDIDVYWSLIAVANREMLDTPPYANKFEFIWKVVAFGDISLISSGHVSFTLKMNDVHDINFRNPFNEVMKSVLQSIAVTNPNPHSTLTTHLCGPALLNE